MSKYAVIEWVTGNHEACLKISDAVAAQLQADLEAGGSLDNTRNTYAVESFSSVSPHSSFPGSITICLGHVIHVLFYDGSPYPIPDQP